jgi:two-component system cell cycle response regulator
LKQLLAKMAYFGRRLLAERIGLALIAMTGIWLARGRFTTFTLWPIVLASAALCLLAARFFLGWPKRRRLWVQTLDQLELGLLLLAVTTVIVQLTGGPGGVMQPLLYVAIAFLVGFNSRFVGGVLIAFALAGQVLLHVGQGPLASQLLVLGTRSGFLLLFSLANLIFLQAEIARRRSEHDASLAEEIRRLHKEAQDYRLIKSPLSSDEPSNRDLDEARLSRGAVQAIHQSMFFVLDLLKKSLDLQTCVLLWLDGNGRQLRIKELVTESNLVTELPISAQAGAIGGVIKNRLAINLSSLRNGARGIPYYSGPEQVGAFVGVPVIEDSRLRGVLCADRRKEAPFKPAEEQLLVEATRHVLRAIQNERVFTAVERSKYEHERFYRASTMLNKALTLAQVYNTAFEAARVITEFDFAALTLYDATARKHTIVKVCGEQADRYEGEVFANNAGLVAMVVKNRHFLPAGDLPRDREPVVFTRRLRVRGLASVVVLPLIVQDNAIGTIALASHTPSRFPKKVREMLGVIANQVAVSIENAKMYKRMEEMATTDGLTSLPNHRTFQSRLDEMLHRAERNGKPVSVVLTDVDKFKSVNDTYGHPVGDQVLKRVAKVLSDQVRKIDLVARYGGEEFAIVLEETDSAGAVLLCERVRKELAAQVMSSEQGSFRVTISLGIASGQPMESTSSC